MENKTNIAELLKDCPSGMELDCTMWDNVVLDHIDMKAIYPIYIKRMGGRKENLTKNGCFNFNLGAKCVIFPKGKTTWEGFQRPFKDGDIVATESGVWIGIVNHQTITNYAIYITWNSYSGNMYYDGIYAFERLATEEEKQKLFKAIKANGYRWNAETKTLEKLIEPKFKVGDKVRHKTTNKDDVYEISKVYDDSYGLVDFTWMIYMKYQDQYELVPDKFDITTLKPFDKVLVRGNVGQKWTHDFFGFMDKDKGCPFVCVGHYVIQCIPYEGNEHLLGTTNDCDEYYKTW